ncbi:DUF262 domain-containing protein [Amphibacillus jilinensis]|uniref:DUF262 domain-containing protein n=1 Tax=Amphibacillus jilinensis TaxID=1216008 RepID=UPI0002D97772|nr:DUF262 domain-containing protein [Amphibacillus jilinensis]
MKAGENHLLNLLSNNDVTFFIPPYQRNYEWDKNQCKVFFNDIKRTAIDNINGQENEHFFGTIVYVKNDAIFGQPSKLVLTDGQQRITTAMLFLVAIREVVDDDNSKKFINNKYLKNNNVTDDTEYKIKLKQVETDWEAYRNIILNLNLTDENKKSAVYLNYSYFVSELNKLKKEDEISLIDMISYGLAKFSIVTIELQPTQNKWENPQEIFESMNSLGKPLSLADLVRNYLLLGKKPDVQDNLYKDYWLHIEKQLPEEVSNFIRDFMQLRARKALKKATANNYKELYAEFKYLFEDSETEILLNDLNKYSNYYSYIVLGKPSGSSKIDDKLRDLRTIGVTIVYSFLLALLNNWKNERLSEQDLVAILDSLIVYFLRRRILKLTQGENKNFPPLVKEIDRISSSVDKKQLMFEILSSQENSLRLPNDIEMTSELNVMNFYNFNQVKFILSLVEEKITKSRPDKNDNTLQIEHIMPQKLNNTWEEELGADYEIVHQEYLNNIGNLTLIRHNQELGNKCFKDKKGIYNNNAGLQIAKNNIVNRAKWNKNSIQNRSKWLIEFMLNEVLNIPNDMRRKNNFIQNTSRRLSFQELGIIGQEINYISDKTIVVKVVEDKKVEFEGGKWNLSPLTREIESRKGTVNASGSYQGAQYWEFEGMKLSEIM